jgi:flagellar biosynthesis component FlhA
VFAVLSAIFAVIVCVITLPMFAFVYLGAAYGKVVEKLSKRKEAAEPEPGAAAQ